MTIEHKFRILFVVDRNGKNPFWFRSHGVKSNTCIYVTFNQLCCSAKHYDCGRIFKNMILSFILQEITFIFKIPVVNISITSHFSLKILMYRNNIVLIKASLMCLYFVYQDTLLLNEHFCVQVSSMVHLSLLSRKPKMNQAILFVLFSK